LSGKGVACGADQLVGHINRIVGRRKGFSVDGTLWRVSTGAEADLAQLGDGPWDGRALPYIPGRHLNVSSSLQFHADFDDEIDPVTYQVVRWKLWSANLEHSDTVKRVSGSPIIVYMDDFNTSILTEDGDNLVCGPSIQFFTGLSDLVIKWTLEHRSDNPGISEGDVFLQNDPYIGAPHQMDVALYTPVFWDGRLFCWLYSAGHFGDIGGMTPGSFCAGARDIFDEPSPVPPIKLSRGGVLQTDVAEMFARTSRTPEMVALQLRSQLAGLHTTAARMRRLIEGYSPETVKGTMRRMISDCSEAVGRRLSSIPDGVWRERLYLSSITPEDGDVHPIALSIRKEGEQIVCSNSGTGSQSNAVNCTYGAWRSALISAASTLLAFDQMYCPAGVLTHMKFEPTVGTLNCAAYPAAVTTVTSLIVSMNVSMQALSRMVLCGSEDVRETALASGGQSMGTWYVVAGTDRRGRFITEVAGDSLYGAIGAFAGRDGIDTGGSWWWPNSLAGEAEQWEQSIPFLYLFRRQIPDSGGAGRWRGGNGSQAAVVGHKTGDTSAQLNGADPAVNVTPGLAGGYPGHSGNDQYIGGSRIRELLAKSILPSDAAAIKQHLGPMRRISPMAVVALNPDDVLVFDYSAGAGVGDPLLRPPASVAADVNAGRISAAAGERHYGVVLDDAGAVDEPASVAAREAICAERRRGSVAVREPLLGGKVPDLLGMHPIGPGVGVIAHEDRAVWVCAQCREILAELNQNPKWGTLRWDRKLPNVDAQNYPNPGDFCNVEIVFRQYLCPGCTQSVAIEVCPVEDEPLWENELHELPHDTSADHARLSSASRM
jgi:N-methylhydantoinase B